MGKIFSGKDQKGRDKKRLEKILYTDDIRKLSKSDRQLLQRYLKSRQKKIANKIAIEPDLATSKRAQEENLANRRISSSPKQLLNELYTQNQFFTEYNSDIQLREDIETSYPEVGEFANEIEDYLGDSDNPYIQHYEETPLVKDADKWTILRRLAVFDQRLNLDRAYASETLKDLEAIIEEHQFDMTYDEIADMLIEDFAARGELNREWNKSLQTLQDIKLTSNKGFHGIEKAEKAWNSKYKKFNIDNFEPVW